MKTTILLPHRFKTPGALVLLSGLVLGVLAIFGNLEFDFLDVPLPKFLKQEQGLFSTTNNNLTDELALGLCIAGCLLLMFSREKVEDEFVQHQRLLSLQWAVLVNYVILFIANWLVYDTNFFYVMTFNLIAIPLFFLLRFHWILWRSNQN
ncbi:MAG: hypothetical protein IT270_06055 [Saprospiraceae bacterium]|nr:hypothetical protein [Saprospiraceae bacterium]